MQALESLCIRKRKNHGSSLIGVKLSVEYFEIAIPRTSFHNVDLEASAS